MDIKGDNGYLTIQEQIDSGYTSPINFSTFDLHAERELADGEIDAIQGLMNGDPHELTHVVRAELPKRLQRAETRSNICRQIAKIVALRNMTGLE
jgi:hypothetical protein